MIFPLSSPFAMLARAALQETLWVHAAALAWQAFAVIVLVKGGSLLFRKRVMQSGGAGREKKPRNLKATRGRGENQGRDASATSLEPAE
jgi:ABC-2 type transport system permease protein